MEKINQNNKYISTTEAARVLKISRISVFNKIRKGIFPAERFGRSYLIPIEFINTLKKEDKDLVKEEKRVEIKKAVRKVVKEYGETLRLLGKE